VRLQIPPKLYLFCVYLPFLQLVKQIHGQQQGQMLSIVINCPMTNNAAIFSNYIMQRSKNTVLYILQLLAVPSEHHLTSIPITLAETVYYTLYKILQPK
jgi:hypothetical protein